jgi:hypothetical protein
VGAVEVVQRVSLIESEVLEVLQAFLLTLEVKVELLVVFISVIDLESVPVGVLDLVHC